MKRARVRAQKTACDHMTEKKDKLPEQQQWRMLSQSPPSPSSLLSALVRPSKHTHTAINYIRIKCVRVCLCVSVRARWVRYRFVRHTHIHTLFICYKLCACYAVAAPCDHALTSDQAIFHCFLFNTHMNARVRPCCAHVRDDISMILCVVFGVAAAAAASSVV